MGNFLGANKVGAAEPEESLGVGSMAVPLLVKASEPSILIEAPKKKVRFQVEDRVPSLDEYNKADGIVKFRIAVTKEEQRKIVDNMSNGLRYSSVEEMLQAMEVTSRKISDVTSYGAMASQKWKSELDFLSKKQL